MGTSLTVFQRFEQPQEFVLDLSQRGYSNDLGSLGAIEGNVDKPADTSGPDGWLSIA